MQPEAIRESDKPLKVLGPLLSMKLRTATQARRRLAALDVHVQTQDLRIGTPHRPTLVIDGASPALRQRMTQTVRKAAVQGTRECTARFAGCDLVWVEPVAAPVHTNVAAFPKTAA